MSAITAVAAGDFDDNEARALVEELFADPDPRVRDDLATMVELTETIRTGSPRVRATITTVLRSQPAPGTLWVSVLGALQDMPRTEVA
ncbi:MAG TPA: hypothetical protein VJ777_22950 [Mycobacterium sp.]|nr:hypothetical protein [Mycobacterium sp.]